jgi:hypothetical protein
MLTDGARLNTEAVQAALGVFPKQVAVGQTLEVLVLLQSIYDQRVEGSVTIQLPKRDSNGNAVILFVAQETILVTLNPGEVGLLHIPITPQIPTPAAEGYSFSVSLDFRRPRGKLIRDVSGGRAPGIPPMSPIRLNILRHEVGFDANQRGANTRMLNTLSGSFGVMQNVMTAKTGDYTPRWESLWDASKLSEDQAKYAVLEARTQRFATQLTRLTLYEPLIDEIDARFTAAKFPVLPGEAVMIAKVMIYAVEDGLQTEQGFNLAGSRWFQRLANYVDDEVVLEDSAKLASVLLTPLLHDSMRLAYHMVGRAIQESKLPKDGKDTVGTPEDHLAQANRLTDGLERGLPMNLGLIYPLVLAGLMLHAQVKVPAEGLWDTLEAVRSGWAQRQKSGVSLPPLAPKWLDVFANSAQEFLTRTRVPRS